MLQQKEMLQPHKDQEYKTYSLHISVDMNITDVGIFGITPVVDHIICSYNLQGGLTNLFDNV